MIDSPSTAEGVVESVASAESAVPTPLEAPEADVPEAAAAPVDPAPVIVRTTLFARPDIHRLAARAAEWADARRQAIEEGLVEPKVVDAPSNTNLRLLPVVRLEADQPDDATEPVDGTGDEPASGAGDVPTESVEAPEPAVEDEPAPAEAEPDEPAADDPAPDGAVDPDAADPVDGEAPEPDAGEPPPGGDPAVDPADDGDAGDGIPEPPAQVNGRVPPPAAGPTAAQWDALRRCESTHDYQAISPSGLYRGAYQFSQQTWDWVAEIHWPFLVGIDPIDAPPGWQDIMAYTLYAMRGWDQWPICGKYLL